MRAIIYARKSTDRADRQQLSVENQVEEAMKIAEREGCEIIKIIKESKSAKDPGRPGFNEMMSLVSKGKVDCIITWKLNRLARNPIDEGTIKWSLQNALIKAIYVQGEVFRTGDNVLIMGMHFGMSTQYILELKADSERGVRKKMAQGGVCQVAPIGYINNRVEKSIEVDPEKSPWVKEMFELRANKFSYREISEKLYEKGLRKKNGEILTASSIETSLNNKFYIGLVKRFGEYYKGNYPLFISNELFQKAQEAGRGMHTKSETPRVFHLKGLLKGTDGYYLSGYQTKGITYYKTSSRSIEKINLSEKKIIALCDKMIEDLEINSGFIDLNKVIIKDLIKLRKPQNEETLKSISYKIEKLQKRKSELLDLRLDGELNKEQYIEKKNDIVSQIQVLEDQKSNIQNDDFEKKIKTMFELAETPYQRYKSKNIEQKSVFLKNYMFELFVKNKKELSVGENSWYSCLKLVQKHDFSNLEAPPGFEPGYKVLQTSV